MSKYGVVSGPYFRVFVLNTEIYEANLRIQPEYRKIRTKNNSVFGHFSRSGTENEYSKFATKKWYAIDSESKGVYSHENSIKFLINSLESSLCNYSDTYVLVTGNIAVVGANNNTKVAFKNRAPFRKCRTEVNETFIDKAEHINIAMPMNNLTECSDNCSDTSGS